MNTERLLCRSALAIVTNPQQRNSYLLPLVVGDGQVQTYQSDSTVAIYVATPPPPPTHLSMAVRM